MTELDKKESESFIDQLFDDEEDEKIPVGAPLDDKDQKAETETLPKIGKR